MARAFRLVKDEVIELLPAAIFFLLAFNLVVLTDALTTERYGITVFTYWSASIAALIMAKVIAITDLLPFMNIFSNKPLIYNALWKAFLYFLVNIALKYIELLIRFWSQYGSFASANAHIATVFDAPRFWAVQIWFAVLLLTFTSLQELTTALGNHKLRQLFFGR